MEVKQSNPVLFLLMISTISLSNADLQLQTLFLSDDDAWLNLHKTAASIPDSQLGSNVISLEMIRRDHHPTFAANNVNLSRNKILKRRLKRDQVRVTSLSIRVARHHSSSVDTPVFSGNFISNDSGEYFTRLGIGTPVRDLYMILDTGSDLIWIQCDPCINCYSQIDPIFVPNRSSTYYELPCGSELCNLLNSHCQSGNKCPYQMQYGDNSSTKGDLANETLTLGYNRVAGIALGCGYNNTGLWAAAAGILGLGGGKLSFSNQLGGQQYRRQFSYCLVSRGSNRTSIIMFGQTPLSNETRFTPMLTDKKMDTFYYLNLTGISVGGSEVQGVNSTISKIPRNGMGGVIMDSGTTITWLKLPAYIAVRNAFRNVTDKFNLTQVTPPAEFIEYVDTCYDLSGVEKSVSVPTVVLHFDGGAEMQLRADNCLVPVDHNGTFCFAFTPSNDISIIGNFQQQGFGINFNLETNIIGITPDSC